MHRRARLMLQAWLVWCLAVASSAGCRREHPPSAEALAQWAQAQAGAAAALSAAVDTRQESAPAIVLTVVSAAGLADFDDGLGESDPYVEVECNGRRARTSVVDGELDPVWGDRFALPCGAGAPLDVTVWDSDAMSDERIAVTTTTIPNVAVEQTLEWTVPLGAEATSHVVLRAQGAALAP